MFQFTLGMSKDFVDIKKKAEMKAEVNRRKDEILAENNEDADEIVE